MENESNKKNVLAVVIISIILIIAVIIIILMNFNQKLKIEFNTNGGNIIDNQEVKYNGKINRPKDPTKEGYIFDNWYYEDEIFDFNTKIKKSIILDARWKEVKNIETFEIRFIDSDGKIIKKLTVNEKEKILKPMNPKKEGYEFISWQLNGEDFNFNTEITEDITLIANFKKNKEDDKNQNSEINKPINSNSNKPSQGSNNSNNNSNTQKPSSGNNNNQNNPQPEVKITYSVVSTKVEGSAMEEYLYQIKGSDGKYYNGTIEFTLVEDEKITREVSISGIKYPSTLIKSAKYISVS